MKKMIFNFLIFFLACSPNVKMNKNIGIIIRYAHSNEINLINETFTIFYDSKPPTIIKFELSKNEKESIIGKYYDLKLHLLPSKSDYTNECQPSQSGDVLLLIKDNTKFQEIKTGSNCKGSFFSEVSHVERFINLIDKIIRLKPEIKNAPKSDIFYVD